MQGKLCRKIEEKLNYDDKMCVPKILLFYLVYV